tara:strand:- start:4992 stop:6065 length:1074 start_codon:yes stop_codon:yes gene_type:complete
MMVGNKSISCIILNCLNDLFIKERLIPSIKRTTKHLKDWDIEIIVVDNSPEQDFQMEGIRVVKSVPYHIPKAYNLAIKNTTKYYIALFHDDIDILDYNWVLKATQILSEKVYAVGPDFHFTSLPYKKIKTQFFLKEAPMIMERKKFWEVGGYNEEYYFGYEDVKLSNAIHEYGKKIKKVRMKYVHFGGTTSMLIDKDKETQDTLKKQILKFYNLKEYNNFLVKHSNIELVKTNIINKFKSPLMWLIMIIRTRSLYITNLKSMSDHLGKKQMNEYWGLEKVPVELNETLLPQTAEEMDLYLQDIKENKNGELYGKLEKWKNKTFEEYNNSEQRKLDDVTITNIFIKLIKELKKFIWDY